VLARKGRDPSKALSVFHYLRKSDRRILVYDGQLKKWKGCDHVG
jgi:hypothetical protein